MNYPLFPVVLGITLASVVGIFLVFVRPPIEEGSAEDQTRDDVLDNSSFALGI